jgi:hypothetical protein
MKMAELHFEAPLAKFENEELTEYNDFQGVSETSSLSSLFNVNHVYSRYLLAITHYLFLRTDLNRCYVVNLFL